MEKEQKFEGPQNNPQLNYKPKTGLFETPSEISEVKSLTYPKNDVKLELTFHYYIPDAETGDFSDNPLPEFVPLTDFQAELLACIDILRGKLGEGVLLLPLAEDGDVKRPLRGRDAYRNDKDKVKRDIALRSDIIGVALDLKSLDGVRLRVIDIEGKDRKEQEAKEVVKLVVRKANELGLDYLLVIKTPHGGYHILFLVEENTSIDWQLKNVCGTDAEIFSSTKAYYPLISKKREYFALNPKTGKGIPLSYTEFVEKLTPVPFEVVEALEDFLKEQAEKAEPKKSGGDLEASRFAVVASISDWEAVLKDLEWYAWEEQVDTSGNVVIRLRSPFCDDGRNWDAYILRATKLEERTGVELNTWIYYDFHDNVLDKQAYDIVSFYQKFVEVRQGRRLSRSEAYKEVCKIVGRELPFVWQVLGDKQEQKKSQEVDFFEEESPADEGNLTLTDPDDYKEVDEGRDKRLQAEAFTLPEADEGQSYTTLRHEEERNVEVIEENTKPLRKVEVLGYSTGGSFSSGSSLFVVLWHNGKLKFLNPDKLTRRNLRLLGFQPPQEESEDFTQLKEELAKRKGRRVEDITVEQVEDYYFKRTAGWIISQAHRKGEVNPDKRVYPGVQRLNDKFVVVSGEKVFIIGKSKVRVTSTPVLGDVPVVIDPTDDWVELDALVEGLRRPLTALREAFREAYRVFSKFNLTSKKLFTSEVLLLPLQALRDWRPIIYIYGPHEAGKSTLLATIADFYRPHVVERESITGRALELFVERHGYKVFVHDEFTRSKYWHDVLNSLVAACSGKGTGTERATISQTTRFFEAPIEAVLAGVHLRWLDEQSKSRLLPFYLRRPSKNTRPPIVNPQWARRVRSLFLGGILALYNEYETLVNELRTTLNLGSRRLQDNVAYAVALLELIGEEHDLDELEVLEVSDDNTEMLNLILSLPVPDGGGTVVVEDVLTVIKQEQDERRRKEQIELANKRLRVLGIKVLNETEVAFYSQLVAEAVAKAFPQVTKALGLNASMISSALRAVARQVGGKTSHVVRFTPQRRGKSVVLPLRFLISEEK